MTFTWLVGTVLGTGILLWNRTFISMWVGEQHFVGSIPDLLIVLGVFQFVLIRNDANVIDLTLKLGRKVILGGISVSVSILAASALVYFYKMGIIGVILGIMIGRFILSIAYPRLIGQMLQINGISQIKAIIRPALVTILLFLVVTRFESNLPTQGWHSWEGWAAFILSAALTACIALGLAFLLGLTGEQKKTILHRIQAVVNISMK